MLDKKQGGFIKLLVLFVILIVIISYLGIDLRAIVQSPETQGNLGYVWGLVVTVWDNYLERPVLYFWNNIFINLLWESFVNNMERIKNGGSFDFIPTAPSVGTTTQP